MARQLRRSYPNALYHITCRENKREGKVRDVREILTFSWTSSPNNRFESDVKRLAPFHAAQAERWVFEKMVNPKKTSNVYCDRVHKKIALDANRLPSGCRHFVVRNGKPVCKKMIDFPLLTPGSIAKLMFRTILEPIAVFTSISFGRAMLPSWWCKLCAHGAKPSKALEVAGNAVGFTAGGLADISGDAATDMIEGIEDALEEMGRGAAETLDSQ